MSGRSIERSPSRSGQASRVVLLGHGISYSASPAMQGAGFAAAGLRDWTYALCDVEPAALAAAVRKLRGGSYVGANVTIPHKQAVVPMLDEVDGEARALGAVNTIVRRDGLLVGSNTDLDALRWALGELRIEPAGASAVVLGGGGSARAAGRALEGADVLFVVRHPARTAGLAPITAWTEPGWRRRLGGAAVVVNATPLGRHGELPFDLGLLAPGAAVIDLVYVRGGTPLVRAARAAGVRCVDGWQMLLAQGTASFRAWTGLEPPVAAMRAALEAVSG